VDTDRFEAFLRSLATASSRRATRRLLPGSAIVGLLGLGARPAEARRRHHHCSGQDNETPCGVGKRCCDGSCVDVLRSPRHCGTAAPAPPSAGAVRNAPEEVAVSRRRLTRAVPVPPGAAPAVHRRPAGRWDPPSPAVKALPAREPRRRARAGSAPAPDTARSLPDVWLPACPRALPGRTRHLARWGS
jgi:hypothetical protein